jgi:hypothetical protein
MTRYTADGFRAVTADSASDAAQIFADRQARREYGRNGYSRRPRLDCWTQDGKSHTFEAFIGRPGYEPRTMIGRNVWIYVRREPGA